VTFVAREHLSADRAGQGWVAPEVPGVIVEIDPNEPLIRRLAMRSSGEVHLTEGLRRNGYIQDAVLALKSAGARWGVMMEGVDDRGLAGVLKRLDYRVAFTTGKRPDFILAIGSGTGKWITDRGFPGSRVFPFAYFLDSLSPVVQLIPGGPMRIGYVGRLIPLKRVHVLLEACSRLGSAVELTIVGSGPEEPALRRLGARLSSVNIQWRGQLPMRDAQAAMAQLDCLVLPSECDGWGAVVSEALMMGVIAICTDRCGAAAAVEASGVGGIFPVDDVEALAAVLAATVRRGRPSPAERAELAAWARCLGAEAGAEYLEQIAAAVYDGAARPRPPWERIGTRARECAES
jgi:glycosyltransferase involved in cell wall biosynthesis